MVNISMQGTWTRLMSSSHLDLYFALLTKLSALSHKALAQIEHSADVLAWHNIMSLQARPFSRKCSFYLSKLRLLCAGPSSLFPFMQIQWIIHRSCHEPLVVITLPYLWNRSLDGIERTSIVWNSCPNFHLLHGALLIVSLPSAKSP